MAKDTAQCICVYRHIRMDKNVPFYIGIGSVERANSKLGRNNIWNKISNKTDYEVEILFYDLGEKEAKDKEIEFIKLYGKIIDGTGTLCNISDGGEGGYGVRQSDESKQKRREKIKGKKLSIEHRKKISQSHKGKIPDKLHMEKLMNGCRIHHKEIVDAARLANQKKVIDISTGVIYNSGSDAAKAIGIPRNTMYGYLNIKRKNKTNFTYV